MLALSNLSFLLLFVLATMVYHSLSLKQLLQSAKLPFHQDPKGRIPKILLQIFLS